MSNILDSSKTQLGKLLASENIRIEHQKVHGPYFDVKERLLVLPIWKDMSADMYDLMIGHEVGHALFTPSEGWMDEVKAEGKEFKTFLNIVEDARIEKKMKRKYPGLRKPMYNGYTELVDRDFFGVPLHEMKYLPFADRLNVYFKLGARADVSFNEKEKDLVDRIDACETWDEVMALAKELHQVAKDEKSQLEDLFDDLMEAMDNMESMQGGEGGEAGEDFNKQVQDAIDALRKAGKDELADALENASSKTKDRLREWMEKANANSITEDSFRSKEETLLDQDALPIMYLKWPKVDTKNWVVPHKTTYKHMTFELHQEEKREQIYNKFMTANKRYIAYLVKEFELRRNAKQLAKAKVSKTGKLDVDKVWSYKLSEDLFLQTTSVPKGKNHGMLMVIDLSSSMAENIAGTIEQVVSLAMFCRKVNIPFDVYGFTDNGSYGIEMMENGVSLNDVHDIHARNDMKERNLCINNAAFRLKQLLTYNMKLSEFNNAVKSLLLLADGFNQQRGYYYYGSRYSSIPNSMQLSGTPLNESILVLSAIAEEFKRATRVEVLNTIILTDGDASYHLGRAENGVVASLDYGHRFIVEHGSNQVDLNRYRSGVTENLLDMYKKVTGSRVIGIYLMAGNNYKSQIWRRVAYEKDFNESAFEAQYKKEFHAHKFFGMKSAGYDVYYMVPGNELSIEEVTMQDVMRKNDNFKKTDLLRAFKKMQNTKMISRVFLNQFIQHVS